MRQISLRSVSFLHFNKLFIFVCSCFYWIRFIVKILAVILCLLGCITLYCSHPHQSLLKQKLSKPYVYAGTSLLIIALILLFIAVPKLVAIYMWLMTMLVVWSLIPFITLFKKNISNEISDATKNPS